MPAGGFKTFVAGEILTAADTNDFLMQGVLVFDDATARDAAITAPVEGQFAFLTTGDELTFYDGSAWDVFSGAPPLFEYVVVGGGGAGSSGQTNSPFQAGSGGGAGGYRCNIVGELTGGSNTVDPPFFLDSGSFTVTVGAGGASVTGTATGNDGSDSRFGSILGYGGGGAERPAGVGRKGGSGGAGGAGAGSNNGPSLLNQGSDGGASASNAGGGGGGAGAVGANATTNVGGNGGAGLSSSITGSSVPRGGGGAGRGISTDGTGGTGGGGAVASAGTVNTGGGGGGSILAGASGAGGSGIVIIKYPDSITLTIGAGLTSSTATAGGFKTTTFTAGTDTVSF